MANREIGFDRTAFDSLGRNRFIQTHGVAITALGDFPSRGTVWFQPITSRGVSDACRVVIAASALDEVIAALTSLKAELEGTAGVEINRVLFTSTAHLPEDYLDRLSRHVFEEGSQASFAGQYGIVLWAPAEPDDHDFGDMPDSVQLILRHARNLGCTHVVFDRDAETLDGFETYDEADNGIDREEGFIVEHPPR